MGQESVTTPVVSVGQVWYSPTTGNRWYVLGSKYQGKYTLWEVRRPYDKESYYWRAEAFQGMEVIS